MLPSCGRNRVLLRVREHSVVRNGTFQNHHGREVDVVAVVDLPDPFVGTFNVVDFEATALGSKGVAELSDTLALARTLCFPFGSLCRYPATTAATVGVPPGYGPVGLRMG